MISLNFMFAAGLFDSPWVVAAIVIIGAFINWLSQWRQQKQQQEEERQARAGESESPQKPSFDVEEALRRLLGEEAPKSTPAPPPLPHPAASPSRPAPPVMVALPVEREFELGNVHQPTTARMAQVAEQVRQHQLSAERVRRTRGGPWSGLWRDRSSVRRAFVGSLVFGPPKGLES
jgi:hypothetical protein